MASEFREQELVQNFRGPSVQIAAGSANQTSSVVLAAARVKTVEEFRVYRPPFKRCRKAAKQTSNLQKGCFLHGLSLHTPTHPHAQQTLRPTSCQSSTNSTSVGCTGGSGRKQCGTSRNLAETLNPKPEYPNLQTWNPKP